MHSLNQFLVLISVLADRLLNLILRLLVDLMQERERRILEVLCLVFYYLGDDDASASFLDGAGGTEVDSFFSVMVLGSP